MTEPTWAIVTTRAMCEDVVERGFWQVGYRAYVPRYRRVLQPHGRYRKPIATMRPVFPGLVFVQDWRGWPQERISHIIGRMCATRSRWAMLSGQDIAVMMERERGGEFEPQAPRPPANGIVTREDLIVGGEVGYELSGEALLGVLDGLSNDGKATISLMILGRSVKTEVNADALYAVSA